MENGPNSRLCCDLHKTGAKKLSHLKQSTYELGKRAIHKKGQHRRWFERTNILAAQKKKTEWQQFFCPRQAFVCVICERFFEWQLCASEKECKHRQIHTIRHFVAFRFYCSNGRNVWATMKKAHTDSERARRERESVCVITFDFFFTSIECARILWFVDSFFAWRRQAGRQKKTIKTNRTQKRVECRMQCMCRSNGMKCAHTRPMNLSAFSRYSAAAVMCVCVCACITGSHEWKLNANERIIHSLSHTKNERFAMGQRQQRRRRQQKNSSRNCVRASSKSPLNALCV